LSWRLFADSGTLHHLTAPQSSVWTSRQKTMLGRFSISISVATIIGILGKLAFIYHNEREAGKDWFAGPVDQAVLCYLLLAVFLVFFRGKMMHDDATFFADIDKNDIFKSGRGWKLLIKLGLLCGYSSWLLWAPAIFFLEDLGRISGFLIASLLLSTIWLIIDILTRITLEWRRAFWVIPNIFYVGFLALMAQPNWASLSVIGLLVVLVIDWLVSDPLSGHV
jgi:hypothetical protein